MTAYIWSKRPSGILDLLPCGTAFTDGQQIATVQHLGGRRWRASVEYGDKATWWLVGAPHKGKRLVVDWLYRHSWDFGQTCSVVEA